MKWDKRKTLTLAVFLIVGSVCLGIVGYFSTRQTDEGLSLAEYTQLTPSRETSGATPHSTGGQTGNKPETTTPAPDSGSPNAEMPHAKVEDKRTHVPEAETSPHPNAPEAETSPHPLADQNRKGAEGIDQEVLPPDHLTQDDFPFQELPSDALTVEFPLVLVRQDQVVTVLETVMPPALGGQPPDAITELQQSVYRIPRPPPPTPRPRPPGPKPGPPEESPSGL